jgi:hypothetical protein
MHSPARRVLFYPFRVFSNREPATSTFSIRVVNKDGRPISLTKIRVKYGLFNGSSTALTSDTGWAQFGTYDKAIFRIFINSEDRGKFAFKDGDTKSFTFIHPRNRR